MHERRSPLSSTLKDPRQVQSRIELKKGFGGGEFSVVNESPTRLTKGGCVEESFIG